MLRNDALLRDEKVRVFALRRILRYCRAMRSIEEMLRAAERKMVEQRRAGNGEQAEAYAEEANFCRSCLDRTRALVRRLASLLHCTAGDDKGGEQ